MAERQISSAQSDARPSPRALVRASAFVKVEGARATHHMTYELSACGARLCGLPAARPGDRVEVLLCLPRVRIEASGRLVRVGSSAVGPDFAVEFHHLTPDAEDAVHDAVALALESPSCRSVFLFRSEQDEHLPGWGWLGPILEICTTATTPVSAVECLEDRAIEMAILSMDAHAPQPPHWADAYPEISWHRIDEGGCLSPIRTTVGPIASA